MEILIIGGREFLGRHIVNRLINSQYKITLFNRGLTNPDLFSDLKLIVGDRQKDFDLLSNQNWDVVIDTSGYFPFDVSKLAEVLSTKVKHYIFISSTSVYDYNVLSDNLDETSPIVNLDIDQTDNSWGTYGARKYLCELAINKFFSGRATFIRPGLIVGPHDSTYRFAYWGDRVSEGGVVLAPGYYDSPLQFIDARDLANWVEHIIQNKIFGTYNAIGPSENNLSLGKFLDIVAATLNPNVKFKWVSENILKDKNVGCWSELPLWVYKDIEVFLKRDVSNAIKNGLTLRTIEETVKDTFEWSSQIHEKNLKTSVLSREREKEILNSIQ